MHQLFMAEAKKILRKALGDIGYTVYDYSTDDETFPYFRFGYCYESKYSNKTHKIKTVSITLDIWSDKRGSAELMGIVGNIENALDGYEKIYNSNYGEINYNLVKLDIGTIEILEENLSVNGANKNKKIYHGILPIEIILMEVQHNG